MRRVVTGMTSNATAQAGTALSPEWDRWFDEVFTELVTSDPGLVRDEFDALIGANFDEPPTSPPPPVAFGAQPAPRPTPPGPGDDTPAQSGDQHCRTLRTHQRSPP
jgi:hypothetical protein